MKFKALVLAMTTATLLVACGGGGGDEPAPNVVAAIDTTTAIDKTTGAEVVSALNNTAISFPSGINADGLVTTGATTLTLQSGAKPTFTLATEQGSASGELAFGSCIFTVTSLNPNNPTNPLYAYLGQTLTVNPCTLKLPTAKKPANGSTIALTGTLDLDGSAGTAPLNVVITQTGRVTINGFTAGRTEVATITGATGAGN